MKESLKHAELTIPVSADGRENIQTIMAIKRCDEADAVDFALKIGARAAIEQDCAPVVEPLPFKK